MTGDLEHSDEYHDAMIDMLEFIWGDGFMAPGGAETVRQIARGLDLKNKDVLDIGCGIGGGDIVLAREFGARVIGTDLEAPLLARARDKVERAGLGHQIEFRQVTPGPLAFPDNSFDLVYSSGAFTQIEDKAAMFSEVFRVLKPGGVFSTYDWMKKDGPYSNDMHYWFKMEGLTYAMDTLDNHRALLTGAGFVEVEVSDDEGWYRERCRREYEQMTGRDKNQMLKILGPEQQAHFTEDWLAMMVVLEKGELLPGYCRAVKPR